jgi:hypothetical protein
VTDAGLHTIAAVLIAVSAAVLALTLVDRTLPARAFSDPDRTRRR